MPQVLDAPESTSEGRTSFAIDALQPPAISLDTSPAKVSTLRALLRAGVAVCRGSRGRYAPPLPHPSQQPEMPLDRLIRIDPFLYAQAMCG